MDSACRAVHHSGSSGGSRGSCLFRGLNYTDPCTISFRFFLTPTLSAHGLTTNAGLHPLALTEPRTRRQHLQIRRPIQ